MSSRLVLASIALFLLVVTGGCSGSARAGAAAHTDAPRAVAAIDRTAAVTYVSAYFGSAGSAALRATPTSVASAQLVDLVTSRVRADLSDPACATVDTNGATYLELRFDRCIAAGGELGLQGSVRAEIGFETVPCSGGACPVAVVYDLSTVDLELGASSVIGSWEVRDSLGAGAPTTWAGLVKVGRWDRGVTFTNATAFGIR